MSDDDTPVLFEGLVETADSAKVDLQALVEAQATIVELLASGAPLDDAIHAAVRGLEDVLVRATVAFHTAVEADDRVVTTAPNVATRVVTAMSSVHPLELAEFIDSSEPFAPVELVADHVRKKAPALDAWLHNDDLTRIVLSLVTAPSDPIPAWLVVFVRGADPASDNERALIRAFAHFVRLAMDQHRRELQLQSLIADERQRIAGVIHDDPIQALTAVSLRLQRLMRHVEGDASDQVDALQAAVSTAIERMRRLLIDLHPPSLDDEGLVSAVDAYLGEVLEPMGINCTLHESGDDDLSLGTASLAYRLVVEALWNVVKHADASEVEVSVSMNAGSVDVRISDDGVGFDTTRAARRRAGHMGLSACRELAMRASGSWHVVSEVGRGTQVVLSLPGRAAVDATSPGPLVE